MAMAAPFSLRPLLLSLLLLFTVLAVKSSAQSFKCSSNATCHALVDYVSPNTTTLSHIKTLFSIKNLRSILGANNLPLSTSPNQTVAANQTIRIAFPCLCRNGTGVSDRKPIYTVQKGDTLYHIAAEVFSGLTTFPQIAALNNISQVTYLIEVDQRLWIPLPCSCDEVAGEKVVHYGHVVEAGSSLQSIAQEYGTTRETLMSLNSISNDSSLLAGQVLDVPLQACNSSVTNADSPDYPLLVANGTYVFTADNCVRCQCDAANNWTLQCEPSGLSPSNWSTCPAMQCAGADNLSLGNTTTTSCSRTTCAYAGFSSNQTVFTTLATESTCPAGSPEPGSYASRISSSWGSLFIFIHLILLSGYIL